MANCTQEIVGIQRIALYINKDVRFNYPDTTIETKADLYANGEGSYEITEVNALIKWERTVGYSGNYKQNFFDEFKFFITGIENDIPEIIKTLRNNRIGYIVDIVTTGGDPCVFQSPVFLNEENTKKIDSHTWQVSLSYRIPTFLNYLTRLETILSSEAQEVTSDIEILGIRSIGIYINDNVSIRRPDASKENEVDLIAHGEGSYIIDEVNEYPKWIRTITYSGNYKQNYEDEFTFFLHGINSNAQFIIESLRNNRLGYIIEIITTSGKSFVFPTPVFLDNENTKKIDSHSWEVSLSYRTPTLQDKLTKLNTLLMTESYILLEDNTILGYGDGAITSN